MILIVESGATKTAWRAVCDDGSVRAAQTAGLNPTCLDLEHTMDIVRDAVPELNPEGRMVSDVHFYGAGLVCADSAVFIRQALQMWCPMARMHFYSDLLAAARALFGNEDGVVAIMGTGSNSCLYEGGQIVKNIRPGGYVLGDEGSGAWLGREFLSDFIKGLLPADVEEAFTREFELDYAQIVRKVYKEPAASAFMASLAPFILSLRHNGYVRDLLERCVDTFIVRSLGRYSPFAAEPKNALKAGVVGSFGCACEDLLRQVGGRYGLEFVKFIKSPVDELVTYHIRQENGI